KRVLVRRSRLCVDFPHGAFVPAQVGGDAMTTGTNAEDDFIPVERILVSDVATTISDALVCEPDPRRLNLDGDCNDARLQRIEIALSLFALFSGDLLATFVEILLEGVNGFTVALKFHGRDAKVVEDLPRGG